MTEEQGSYLMDRIRHKCTEDGDCLIWTGGMSSEGIPAIWLDGKRYPLRRLLWQEKNGPIKAGWRVGAECKVQRCIAEEHLIARPRSEELKGIKRTLSTRAKISDTRRAQSKFSPELIQRIRESDQDHVSLARELGMYYQTVYKIRNRPEYVNNPFMGLGART